MLPPYVTGICETGLFTQSKSSTLLTQVFIRVGPWYLGVKTEKAPRVSMRCFVPSATSNVLFCFAVLLRGFASRFCFAVLLVGVTVPPDPDADEAGQRTYAEDAINVAFEAITQAVGRKRAKSMQALVSRMTNSDARNERARNRGALVVTKHKCCWIHNLPVFATSHTFLHVFRIHHALAYNSLDTRKLVFLGLLLCYHRIFPNS